MAHHLVGTVVYTGDVARAFRSLVEERAPKSVALSGGSTALRCYELMAASTYRPASVWFGDERWVAVDSLDSNEGQARRAWLGQISTSIHSLRGTADTIAQACAIADRELAEAEPIDLVHLGMGPDGHTASLFPGLVNDEDLSWISITGDTNHPHLRLTWTVRARNDRAVERVVTVSGQEKRTTWQQMQAGVDLPAQRLNLPSTTWIVDARLRDPS